MQKLQSCLNVFWTYFNFTGHTMNQTAAKAINKERHYGNESVELVRSLSSHMLSHDSGQGFCATGLIEGNIKEWGAELLYLICHTQTCWQKKENCLWTTLHWVYLIIFMIWFLGYSEKSCSWVWKKTELSSKQISESMTLNVVADDIMKYFIV